MHKWSRRLELGRKFHCHIPDNIHPCLLASMPDPIRVSSSEGNPKLFKDHIKFKSCQFLFDGPTNSTAGRWSASSHYRQGVENNELSDPERCANTGKAKRSVSLFMTLMSNSCTQVENRPRAECVTTVESCKELVIDCQGTDGESSFNPQECLTEDLCFHCHWKLNMVRHMRTKSVVHIVAMKG